ncbi:LysR family transcriptional regulator [Amycolatopsis cihanbeyliensis]|uniref:DNA-binding transcriptional LysR family regulator n=1 Tax=Amycolatopsis cihanbeyliensis TaxID=1128664 RepID=A0A542CTJ3_AMYCI|nr:LysR family transcriptional regulator [Amycolatopsis cihanbeyliensis]TQI94145.1 DNA-binding transcriptional LysR family regulator [Amycolatopsis cihanbeyliensis]
MRLELRHLRTVCAIAEYGSVSKAATALGVAQPALTAQLQRIEVLLGGALFERDRRGARPTALGELVLARARVLLPAVEDLQADASRLAGAGPDATIQQFRLGSVGVPFLTGLSRRLEKQFPHALVTTQVSWSAAELAEAVAAGRSDFAIIGVCGDAGAPAEHGLVWAPIAVEPIFVVLSEDDPNAGRAEVDLADLARMRWAHTPGDGCFADCFAAACSRAGFTPSLLSEVDIVTCIDLAQGGDAAVLCQPTFRKLPGLAVVPLAGMPLSWRHLLGWLPTSPAAEFAETVAAHAREAYTDAIARNPRYPRWLAEHPSFDPIATTTH